MEIKDAKVYLHWNKDADGDIVCEFILPDRNRFGFIFCKDDPSGWWFVAKGAESASDGEFSKEFLEGLKQVLNR